MKLIALLLLIGVLVVDARHRAKHRQKREDQPTGFGHHGAKKNEQKSQAQIAKSQKVANKPKTEGVKTEEIKPGQQLPNLKDMNKKAKRLTPKKAGVALGPVSGHTTVYPTTGQTTPEDRTPAPEPTAPQGTGVTGTIAGQSATAEPFPPTTKNPTTGSVTGSGAGLTGSTKVPVTTPEPTTKPEGTAESTGKKLKSFSGVVSDTEPFTTGGKFVFPTPGLSTNQYRPEPPTPTWKPWRGSTWKPSPRPTLAFRATTTPPPTAGPPRTTTPESATTPSPSQAMHLFPFIVQNALMTLVNKLQTAVDEVRGFAVSLFPFQAGPKTPDTLTAKHTAIPGAKSEPKLKSKAEPGEVVFFKKDPVPKEEVAKSHPLPTEQGVPKNDSAPKSQFAKANPIPKKVFKNDPLPKEEEVSKNESIPKKVFKNNPLPKEQGVAKKDPISKQQIVKNDPIPAEQGAVKNDIISKDQAVFKKDAVTQQEIAKNDTLPKKQRIAKI